MREGGLIDRLLLLLRQRRAYLVSGDSMQPTLNDGEVVLIAPLNRPVIGDIVLAAHPYKKSVSVLKRIVSMDENGRFELRGDNSCGSTDSRTFGTVSIEYIKGKAVCRLKGNDRGKGLSSEIS